VVAVPPKPSQTTHRKFFEDANFQEIKSRNNVDEVLRSSSLHSAVAVPSPVLSRSHRRLLTRSSSSSVSPSHPPSPSSDAHFASKHQFLFPHLLQSHSNATFQSLQKSDSLCLPCVQRSRQLKQSVFYNACGPSASYCQQLCMCHNLLHHLNQHDLEMTSDAQLTFPSSVGFKSERTQAISPGMATFTTSPVVASLQTPSATSFVMDSSHTTAVGFSSAVVVDQTGTDSAPLFPGTSHATSEDVGNVVAAAAAAAAAEKSDTQKHPGSVAADLVTGGQCKESSHSASNNEPSMSDHAAHIGHLSSHESTSSPLATLGSSSALGGKSLQFSSSILLSLSDEELLKHLTDELEPTNERSRSQRADKR
jgi:hypothetical protein